MHAHYIQEMEDAVDAIIKRNSLSELWRDRAHVISVAKETKDLKILNDIFDTFIKEVNGCHAKLTQPTLDELDDMEMN